MSFETAVAPQSTEGFVARWQFSTSFSLPKEFVEQYKRREPNFGYNGLGEFVYLDKYSRLKDDGTKEQWWETVERVVNGVYTIQKQHICSHHLGWDEEKAIQSAQEMYERIFTMKFLPPGRGLWMMGTKFVETKGSASLQNCGFVSTKGISKNFAKPFCFMMEASMLGCGIGFDVEGAGEVLVSKPKGNGESITHVVSDSREGWTESLRQLLASYHGQPHAIQFDYSEVRGPGQPIKGFGGISSGPEPLEQLHEDLRRLLDSYDGKKLDARGIADIMNMIGRCVVSGNVRRSAQLILGPNEEGYLDLKNYSWDENENRWKGPSAERAEWGWASNNSVKAQLGMDYSEIAKRIAINGEPGLFWQHNVSTYGRIPEKKHDKATGCNPCSEQPLEPNEMCTLVEVFPSNHETQEDFQRTLKFAYMYGKTVTLLSSHWFDTNRVMLRNRRIGLSISGVAQFLGKHSLDTFRNWCREGYGTVKYYDAIYSDWFCVPRSVRTTTIKPSGTVSIVAGATSGMHFPESRFCIRRIRLRKGSPIIAELQSAGYHIEDDVVDTSAVVVEFPIDFGEGVRTADEVSMWEQLSLAAFLQEHWSDNAISCTIGFKPEEAGHIKHALDYFQYKLKTVSFLPRKAGRKYAQQPIEAITEEQYKEIVARLDSNKHFEIRKEADGSRYCDGETCEL